MWCCCGIVVVVAVVDVGKVAATKSTKVLGVVLELLLQELLWCGIAIDVVAVVDVVGEVVAEQGDGTKSTKVLGVVLE